MEDANYKGQKMVEMRSRKGKDKKEKEKKKSLNGLYQTQWGLAEG